MIKCAVGAGGMFLAASGGGESKSVSVGGLGVVVSQHGSLDLEGFWERCIVWSRIGTLSGLTRTATQLPCLVSPELQSLLR